VKRHVPARGEAVVVDCRSDQETLDGSGRPRGVGGVIAPPLQGEQEDQRGAKGDRAEDRTRLDARVFGV
jgi:hypothetical protein